MIKKPFTLRLPEDLRKAVDSYSSGLGITRSAAIILILRKFFADMED